MLGNVFELFVINSGFPHHGVLFFFVLSGFVLTDSLEHGPSSTGSSAARFFIARLFRIYPAIIATILIFWLTHAVTGMAPERGGYTALSILRNFALLEASIDGVMWTIQSELMAIPLIFAASLTKPRWGPALLAGTLLALSFAGWWSRLGPYPPSRTEWLYAFLFGVVAYHVGRQFGPRFGKLATTVGFVGSVCLFFLAGAFVHGRWTAIFQSLAASGIVASLAFGPKLWVATPLRAPPLRFLGRISYSFYLLHPLTLAVIWNQPERIGSWVEKGVPPVLIAGALWSATTAIILPLAWLMHHTVELPSIRYGKWLWKKVSTKRHLPTGTASMG